MIDQNEREVKTSLYMKHYEVDQIQPVSLMYGYSQRSEKSSPGNRRQIQVDEKYSYTRVDLFFCVVSVVLYLADVVSDLLLCVDYYRAGQVVYFGMTLTFVWIPSFLINVFAFVRFRQNNLAVSVMFCVLQLGAVLRYLNVIYYGLRSRRKDNYLRKDYQTRVVVNSNDASLLRLYESSLEAGPQLVLQLYILLTQRPHVVTSRYFILQMCSVMTSWVGMAWAHVTYQRSLCSLNLFKDNMSIGATFVYFLWRLFESAPRVLAFAVFAEVFNNWVFVVAGVHYLVMLYWYVVHGYFTAEFSCSGLFYDAMSATISVFGFNNSGFGPTRYRCLIYYALFYGENIAMGAVWFMYTADSTRWYYLPVFLWIVAGFYVCVVFHLLFYMWCHPESKRIRQFHKSDDLPRYISLLDVTSCDAETSGTADAGSVSISRGIVTYRRGDVLDKSVKPPEPDNTNDPDKIYDLDKINDRDTRISPDKGLTPGPCKSIDPLNATDPYKIIGPDKSMDPGKSNDPDKVADPDKVGDPDKFADTDTIISQNKTTDPHNIIDTVKDRDADKTNYPVDRKNSAIEQPKLDVVVCKAQCPPNACVRRVRQGERQGDASGANSIHAMSTERDASDATEGKNPRENINFT